MTNLVLNGSFETGDFTNWTGDGTNNNIIIGGGFDDLNYNYIGNTESHKTISQSINTLKGGNYTLNYYLKNDGGEPTQYFAASLDGGTTVIPESVIDFSGPGDLPFMDWTLYTFSFTAGDSTTLSFITQQDPAGFELTAITLIGPPSQPFFRMIRSLYSDNSRVYYQPHSLSRSIGKTVSNSRVVARRT